MIKLTVFLFILPFHLCFADYLFSEEKFQPSKKWYKSESREETHIKNLLRMLVKSESGKELVILANKKARSQGDKLTDILKAGNGSLTDTTLIRKFSVSDPDDIEFESRSVVYINSDLSQYDAVLDLAHELTHFVYRSPFNPYKMNFTLSEFIKSTVEGYGGEAQAFITECQVQKELFPSEAIKRQKCHKIMNTGQEGFSKDKAITHFYEVGKHYNRFKKTLDKHGIKDKFPELNNSTPTFVSSAYGIPYPVAAFEEYLTVLNKVCENDRKRMGYIKQSNSRTPASINQMESDFSKKCADFI